MQKVYVVYNDTTSSSITSLHPSTKKAGLLEENSKLVYQYIIIVIFNEFLQYAIQLNNTMTDKCLKIFPVQYKSETYKQADILTLEHSNKKKGNPNITV